MQLLGTPWVTFYHTEDSISDLEKQTLQDALVVVVEPPATNGFSRVSQIIR